MTSNILQHPDYIDKIENLLYKEKVYLKKGITINQLSKQLQINRSYLSAIINAHFKRSFVHVINDLRIKRACKLLKNPNYISIYTLEHIGSEVGFSNRMTFYRAFRKSTGLSISDWLKSNSMN